MKIASVTSKGRVTIPRDLRRQLGIGQGTRIEFQRVGDHIEMRVHGSPGVEQDSGFGLLKSWRLPVPVDFDPALLLKR